MLIEAARITGLCILLRKKSKSYTNLDRLYRTVSNRPTLSNDS